MHEEGVRNSLFVSSVSRFLRFLLAGRNGQQEHIATRYEKHESENEELGQRK
jgi:hypothetical protein